MNTFQYFDAKEYTEFGQIHTVQSTITVHSLNEKVLSLFNTFEIKYDEYNADKLYGFGV
jgi:hypothetical protein